MELVRLFINFVIRLFINFLINILLYCQRFTTAGEHPDRVVSEDEQDQEPPPLSSHDSSEFDVFLSFRGEDTRNRFTNFLYDALEDKGVYTFIDSERLEKGQRIDKLFDYIHKSKIFVPIFSKGYADSKWCLKEITEIVGCKRLIVPVFYDVEPNVVRHQTGSFKSSFGRHERNRNLDQGEVKKWRAALKEVGQISGYNLRTETNWNEAKLTQIIVKRILKALYGTPPCVENFVIGLDKPVEAVMELLNLQLADVRTVGIFGMGGIGKTTLVETIHNKLSNKFDASCFIYSISGKDLTCLQEQLLYDIFGGNYKIHDVKQGINLIRQRIGHKRILLILDDIDNEEQFSALTGSLDWLCRGSRVIVTTRDEDVLIASKVNERYELALLDSIQALQLFTYHAFRNRRKTEECGELSKEIVAAAGGLPLVLELYGKLYSDLAPHKWSMMLKKLKKCQKKQIHDKLKISFEKVDDCEKPIFLDIACFFIGYDTEYATHMWRECEFYPELALDVLVERSLIKINGSNKFEMHDQIRDMGRQIVMHEYNGELRKRSRLWEATTVLEALEYPQGIWKTRAISLHASKGSNAVLNTEAFTTMSQLRLLHVSNVTFGSEHPHLPKSLKWLQWKGCPFKVLPQDFHPQKVVVLTCLAAAYLAC